MRRSTSARTRARVRCPRLPRLARAEPRNGVRCDLDAVMAEAMAAAGTVRPSTSPNPWVGCVVVTAVGPTPSHGATEPPGGRHAEIVALDAAVAAGASRRPGRHRCRHPRAVRPPRPDPALRRRADRRRRRPGGGRPRRPRPQGGRPGAGPLAARPGSRSVVGVRADEVGAAARALPAPPPHRPALGGAQAGRHPRRPHGRARRVQPVDHRRRRPGPTPTGCGPRATPCWSARARSGPTTPR